MVIHYAFRASRQEVLRKNDPSVIPCAMSTLQNNPFFFGYGSLVNRATHAYPHAARAKLTGWARAWRKTSLRSGAFLTAVQSPAHEIEGLIAAVPNSDWAALDEREFAYHRIPVTQITHDHEAPLDVQVYRTRPDLEIQTSTPHPILLSYLDVVVQGYLREFGTEGAMRFFATTSGWDCPILDDRNAPLYPRAQTLSKSETGFVDDRLKEIGAEFLRP